jgi:hypothetical protein
LHEEILLVYDDGEAILLRAEDNDSEWGPYEKPPVGSRPMFWSAIPEIPAAIRGARA